MPTTKKVPVQETDWEQLNTQNAIWLRDPKDITEGEYEKFYQAISKACHHLHGTESSYTLKLSMLHWQTNTC